VQERIFPARPVRVEAADIIQTSAAPGLTGPLKQPHALLKRDPAIDGTMRRPVAGVEARPSRSRAWLMTVALIEGWVGKEGVPIPWRKASAKTLMFQVEIDDGVHSDSASLES
jgi:hypothetical protein